MKRILCLLLLLSIVSSCGNNQQKEKTAADKIKDTGPVSQVVGIGKIEPENDIIQLSSPVNGIVQKILEKENDSVSVGTPILELDHQLEDGKVRQLVTEVNTQADQVKADEAGVGEYEAKYSNAVSEVQRLQRLLARGAETQQAVDDANTALKSYQSNLKRLQAGISVSKSKLEQTTAALHVAEIERDQKIIRSPVNGKLLELSTLIGSSIDTRQSFAQISPLGKTIAVCEIDEMYAYKVSAGQKAWIRNVGSLDTLSTGTVYVALTFLQKKSLFTDQSGEKEDRRVRTIKIMLDQPDKLLLNARVECVVDISGNLKK
jgi:multidrug resistance efflux pump